MNDVRLSPEHQETIRRLLASFPQVEKAAIFGSRSLGTEKRGSDVDLALYGTIDERTLGRIHTTMDDSVLPYFFDIVVYAAISHEPLRRHIDDHAIVIFDRQPR